MMTHRLDKLLSDFSIVSKGNEEDVVAIERKYGIELPRDYRSFLVSRGGGEGFVGKHYAIFWSASEIIPFNQDYEVEKYAPGLMLFGSSGGGEGFAFDLRKNCGEVVLVPFVGMDLELAHHMACSFTTFLEKLKEADALLR